ncbi:MAG: N-acetylmuramoyl-L-alanine amidase [Alphaproteobacteria bacterium]
MAGLVGTPGWAASSLAVRSVSVEQTGAGSRLVVDLSRDANAQPQFLPAPHPRFVLDLPAANWRAKTPHGRGLITKVRHGEHARSMRLVLDLRQEGRLVASSRTRIKGGVRLVYSLEPVRAAYQPAPKSKLVAVAAPVVAAPVTDEPPAAEAPVAEPSVLLDPSPTFVPKTGRKIVVIDPGHGGQDPGALGKSLGQEKDYNLAAGLALREQLQNRGYQVFMTRTTDVFLPLGDRVKVARDRHADLFISLHSDADPKGLAKGATVYTLSQRGVQRTRTLMDRQDWNVADVGDAGGAAKSILLDLTQRETKDHSARFADALIDRLQGAAPLTRGTPVNAGFFVLLAPDVPAVLLEMGYVTQKDDEKRLADPAARRTLMSAVAASVDDYFETRKTYASVSP